MTISHVWLRGVHAMQPESLNRMKNENVRMHYAQWHFTSLVFENKGIKTKAYTEKKGGYLYTT